MFFDLRDDLLDQYEYATDPVLQKDLHAWDHMHIGAMISYGRGFSNFGRQLMAHQNRVARDGANFLRYLGFSNRAAKNFRAAMMFHDIGKTHSSYNPSIWALDERPTAEQKILQKKHAALGAAMFESFAEKKPDLIRHPHFKIRHAVTLYHHERVDGEGPQEENVTSLPLFVQVACIADSYDGDRIRRPHQEQRRTPREALDRMLGLEDPRGKYAGAFNRTLMTKYARMKQAE